MDQPERITSKQNVATVAIIPAVSFDTQISTLQTLPIGSHCY
jgi:hypothetical protein